MGEAGEVWRIPGFLRDIVQDVTTRMGAELEARHNLRKDVRDRLNEILFKIVKSGAHQGDFDSRMLWPNTFGEYVQKSMASTTFRKAFNMVGTAFHMISSHIVKAFTGKPIDPILKRIELPNDFVPRSSNAIVDGIHRGDQTVISRVLETNLKWLIGRLSDAISLAISNQKTPRIQILLSNPEWLVRTAIRESEQISSLGLHPAENRGISGTGQITALRHIRLQAATLIALNYLKQEHPGMVHVYLRDSEPSARCNLVISPESRRVRDCYFVQLWRYFIGLDSNGYMANDSDWAQRFYKNEVLRGVSSELTNFHEALRVLANKESAILTSDEYSAHENKISETLGRECQRFLGAHNPSVNEYIPLLDERGLEAAWIRSNPEDKSAWLGRGVRTNEALTQPDYVKFSLGFLTSLQEFIEQNWMPRMRGLIES